MVIISHFPKYQNRMGLCVPTKKTLQQYFIGNYFVFDILSLPDMLSYIKHDMNVFTRQNEYEKIPALYDEESKGVWLDEFLIIGLVKK